jgi:hypothetical protein
MHRSWFENVRYLYTLRGLRGKVVRKPTYLIERVYNAGPNNTIALLGSLGRRPTLRPFSSCGLLYKAELISWL